MPFKIGGTRPDKGQKKSRLYEIDMIRCTLKTLMGEKDYSGPEK